MTFMNGRSEIEDLIYKRAQFDDKIANVLLSVIIDKNAPIAEKDLNSILSGLSIEEKNQVLVKVISLITMKCTLSTKSSHKSSSSGKMTDIFGGRGF